MGLSKWDTTVARVGLFANVMPRAVASARAAARGSDRLGIPPSKVGARTVGESAVDELFVAINSIVRDVSSIDDLASDVARCEEAAPVLTELGVTGVNQPQPVPTILRRTRKRFTTTVYELIDFYQEVNLPGPLAPYAPYLDGVVSARVLAHDEPGRRWIIWVHGAGQGRPDDLFTFRAAHLHEKLGYNVILPVLPAHGTRAHPSVDYPGFDPLENVAVTVRAIAEIRALVAWANSAAPADITIAGTSLGGPLAAMVAGLEPSVSSVLALVPMLGVHSTLAHHMDRAGELGKTAAQLLRSDSVTAVTSVVDPLSVMPYAEPDRRLVIAALNDRVTWVTAAQKLHDHWGGRIEWYPGGHVGHVFSGVVKSLTDEFLSTQPS